MSTLQKAQDSVRRRRTSIGGDPRASGTAAGVRPQPPLSTASAASRKSSAQPSPAWDGRINVEEKKPMRVFTQSTGSSLVTPSNASVVASDADTHTSATARMKKKATTTEPQKKKKKSAKVPSLARKTSCADAASSTSLSITPATTARSTAFTATNTAVSQHDNGAFYRSGSHRNTKAKEGQRPCTSLYNDAAGSHWSGPERGLYNDNDNDRVEGLHVDHSDAEGDVLEVSPRTSSENTSFDFKMEETPMSAATPTSHAASSAMVVSQQATAASLVSVEGAEWLRLSSQPVSLQDNVPTGVEEESALAKTEEQSPPRSIKTAATSSPSPSSLTPVPPPQSHVEREEEGEEARLVASARSPDRDAREGAEMDSLPPSVTCVFLDASIEETVDGAVAGGPQGVTVEPAEAKEPQRTQKSTDSAADANRGAEGQSPRKASPPVEEEEGTAPAKPAETTSPSSTEKKATAAEEASEAIPSPATAAGEDGGPTDDAAVALSEVHASTTPPPPAESPDMQLPRYMTGTSVRPVVGVTAASPSPSPSISRARSRLANAPPLQQFPPSSPLLQPHHQQQQRHHTPPPMASPTMTPTMLPRRASSGADGAGGASLPPNASFSSPLTHAAASSARFSRTSSLAEGSPVENSVARRRARRTAAVAALTHGGDVTSTALHRSHSEPLNARAYDERQRSYARPTRDTSAASSRRTTPAAPSLASPAQHDHHHQQQQQPAVLTMELMDRSIYHAVTVDPPNLNERREIPPVTERPLSYYEQGMYSRHKENAPTHYKKALVHEQRALLRNTAWLPVTTMLDQRSGGVGAMMLDDFRHMARVIRYAQELENWRGALTQRARHDAQCTELMQAAAMRSSTLATSMKSTSDAASPKAASPSVCPDNYQMKDVYHGEDADAREISAAAEAMTAKARAPSPSPHKPAMATASATSAAAPPSSSSGVAGAVDHPHTTAAAQPKDSGVRRASLHNPDYSDSDVDEGHGAPTKLTRAKSAAAAAAATTTTAPVARAESSPTKQKADASVVTTTSAKPASAPAPLAKRAASTPVVTKTTKTTTTTTTATTTAKKPEGKSKSHSVKDAEKDKKKKKEKSEAPTFLDWLADAFGVKKGKKEEEAKKHKKAAAATEKTHAAPASKHKTEGKQTSTKPKSATKPDAAAGSPHGQSSTKKAASPPVLVKPATTTTTKPANDVVAPPAQAPEPSPASPSPQHLPTESADTACAPAAAGESASHCDNDDHHHNVIAAPAASTTPGDASSPFAEDLHVSRFQIRSARCCSVELPPAPVPVFRLYNFHPLEVVQELKRMTWWAATHRFYVFRVLTGTTATARAAEMARLRSVPSMGEDTHHTTNEDDEDEDDATGSTTRQLKRRVASPSRPDSPQPRHDPHRRFHESSSSMDSRSPSPSMESLDAAAAANHTHHEAVYFNTVLLQLRIDRWLVRRVVLTRRDAARGLVELEVTEVAEDEAAAAAEREEEVLRAMADAPEQGAAKGAGLGSVADRQVATAMTYFFSSDTRTPR